MRARNLKPGFFKNEDLAEIDPLGRILFTGLWCMADREGRLEDRPKRIKAEILPYDNCDIERYLGALTSKAFITRYSQNGNNYIQVNNFSRHQQPHYKEIASRIPAPIGWKDSEYPGGSIPTEIRKKIFERDKNTCQECGSQEDLTIDHIIPQNRGGQHTEENLRILCRSCNSAKNNRMAAEVGSRLGQDQADIDSIKSLHDPLIPDSFNLIPDSLNLDTDSLYKPCQKSDDFRPHTFSLENLAKLWNEKAPNPLARVHTPFKRSPTKLKKLTSTLNRNPQREFWVDVFTILPSRPFLLGVNDRGWRATFDFVVEHAEEIIDGKYAGTKQEGMTLERAAGPMTWLAKREARRNEAD